MRESVDKVASSHDQPHRPTTSAQRLRTADAYGNPRQIESRASTVALDSPAFIRPGPGSRLTSLSALYQPAFKPYSFSHMYDTKYNNDFRGRYKPPPSPTRPESTNYAAIDCRFGDSMYKQHFQVRQPVTLAFVVPYSRHRRNNPQPRMKNTYPDTSRWIWSSPTKSQDRDNISSQEPPFRGGHNPYRYHRWCSR